MIIIELLVCIIVGYLFGNISTAYFVGKANHIDIRTQGSGNAGATNALRTLGKTAGIITYIGDAYKTVIPVIILSKLFCFDLNTSLIALITGFGVVLGHNYPFWLGFKGGKGIAVTSAVILLYSFTYNPFVVLIYVALFIGTVYVTRYVSVGSLLVTTVFFINVIIFSFGDSLYILSAVIAFLFCASAYFTHRSNIKRLLNGTENKIGGKKNNE